MKYNVVVTIIVIVLIYTNIMTIDKAGNYKSDVAAIQDSVEMYKAKSGSAAYETKALRAEMTKELDSVSKELKIAKVQNVSTIKVVGKTRVVIKPVPGDTVVVRDTTVVTTVVIDSSGNQTIDMDVSLGINVATGTKRKNIFSKTEVVTAVNTTDDRFKISSIKSFDRGHVGPKLIAGPAVITGVGYDFVDNDLSAMIGVGFSIQRWK